MYMIKLPPGDETHENFGNSAIMTANRESLIFQKLIDEMLSHKNLEYS